MKVVGEAGLLRAARTGDPDALAALVERHRAAGLKRARAFVGRQEAPDLLHESMTRVLQAISAGGGPRESFRPYLFRTIRNVHIDWLRRPIREYPVDDVYDLGPTPTVDDSATTAGDHDLIRTSFAALPPRWRKVLWLTEVEDRDVAEVARVLGIGTNAVSALAFRAREGLRGLYLAQHLESVESETCRWVGERLPRLVRHSWQGAEAELVRRHLDDCDECRRSAGTLFALNDHLGALLGPAVLLMPTSLLGRAGQGAGSNSALAAAVVASLAAVLTPVALLHGTGRVVADSSGAPDRSPSSTNGTVVPEPVPTPVINDALALRRAAPPAAPRVAFVAGPRVADPAGGGHRPPHHSHHHEGGQAPPPPGVQDEGNPGRHRGWEHASPHGWHHGWTGHRH